MTAGIFTDVTRLTTAELRAELEAVTRRVDARFGRQGSITAGSRREQLDEARLDELAAELERREQGGRRRRTAA